MLNQLKTLSKANEEFLEIPFVQQLILIIERQSKEIEELKAEIRRLKGHPGKPNIKPSTLEKGREDKLEKEAGKTQRVKRSKKANLPIDQEKKIEAKDVPKGSKFKGYKRVIIQDIEINRKNTLYLLETWCTPEGKYIYGQLPESLQGGDFGPTLKSYILYQYHQCHVTQPLIHEQLKEFGIEISTGQISRILTENKEEFYKEQAEILSAGIQEFPYIQSDDTGARHKGKNGYCTFIGNEFFSYFKSTESKSRINFLELLGGQHNDYHINEWALEYMAKQNLPTKYIDCLSSGKLHILKDKSAWDTHLAELNITQKYVIRIATEGALIGSLLAHGINKNLAIVSDDAGQFNILKHGLCWVHAERNLQKPHCFTEIQEKELEKILTSFWQLYQDLKSYQKQPSGKKAKQLEAEFDAICQFQTNWLALEQVLERLASNKDELLLVLKRPEIPLHNNTSERDIREYVKRRKISGSTRSETGRKARDAFTSLKKTCRKLQISFWEFLNDRISKTNSIENLATLMKQKYACQIA